MKMAILFPTLSKSLRLWIIRHYRRLKLYRSEQVLELMAAIKEEIFGLFRKLQALNSQVLTGIRFG